MHEYYFGHRTIISGHVEHFNPSQRDFGLQNAQEPTGIFGTSSQVLFSAQLDTQLLEV